MKAAAKTLPDDPLQLQEIIARYEKENDLLRERVFYTPRLFGKKSEKGGESS